MSTATHRKWGFVAGLILAAALMVVPSAISDRQDCPGKWLTIEQARDLALKNHDKPCDCSDIPALESRLQDAESEQQQIQAIEDTAPAGDINDAIAAKTGKNNIVGTIQYPGGACTPVVCDSQVGQCSELWLATFEHEQAHCDFQAALGIWAKFRIGLFATFGDADRARAVFQADGEIAARQAEAAYLEQQLDVLKKRCPKRGLYPSLDDNAGDQIKTVSAADRVSSYAAAM